VSKSRHDVANDWIIFGCDYCVHDDFYFCIKRCYIDDTICCPRCGSDGVFLTGEKVNGTVVYDDYRE
jgi:hypothetical protein